MAVNFAKNQDQITTAWREVAESKEIPKWALFSYEGNTNIIKLISTGSNGLRGLVKEFNCSSIQYAFCRVINEEKSVNKLILINWQGESSPLSRKGLCASHVGDVASYFKGCSQTLTIRNDDEATEEYLLSQLIKNNSNRVNIPKGDSSSLSITDDRTANNSAYKRTDIRSEISLDRKSFWQRQEEEEKERLEDEKKRAAERQAQFEKERKQREETEAKKLAETIKERDRKIEATRQAERRESANSQHNSLTSTNTNQDIDDERVGRRSELIRLERNQETQSLISKGLIKNKRAIFEQASQQPQQQPITTLTRRTSGTIITQRLNEFKSLDISGDNEPSVEKLTNGIAKSLNVDESSSHKAVEKEIQPVKLQKEGEENGHVSISKTDTSREIPNETTTKPSECPSPITNGKSDSNEESIPALDNNNSKVDKIIKKNEAVKEETIETPSNGNLGIKARALYDYQAADNTEISFDPDDIIGFIDKVDSGWWQGSVITGRFKGQCGLFPNNYVEEIHVKLDI